MEDKVFGLLEYNAGWSKKEMISLWDGIFEVKIIVDAYENEKPNAAQQEAYQRFKCDLNSLSKLGKRKLQEYLEVIKDEIIAYTNYSSLPLDIVKIVTPKQVIFFEDGDIGILCDASWDNHGVAVLFKECEIIAGTQDIVWR